MEDLHTPIGKLHGESHTTNKDNSVVQEKDLNDHILKPLPVEVPEDLFPLFKQAHTYVEKYFSKKELDPQQGILKIAGQRYILVRASSLSVEFLDLVKELYKKHQKEEALRVARGMLFDLAHALGRSDARKFYKEMGLNDPLKKLSAGPIHFAYTGWGLVSIAPDSHPSPDNDFYLAYKHFSSFEADSWLEKNIRSNFPVCVMNAGYSSGWCEESFGIPLVAVEVKCKAKGDNCCQFIMAPPQKIKAYLQKYEVGISSRNKNSIEFEVPEFFEKKHLEIELRNSEETARALLNAPADRALLLDTDGTILMLNKTAAEALGGSVDELVGKNAFDLFPPSVAAQRKTYHDKVLETGSPIHYEDVRDGRWLDTRLYPVHNSAGRVTRVAVFSKDITDVKNAQKELKLHKDHLERLIAERTSALERLNKELKHEIAERKKAQEALKRSEERYKSLVEESFDGIFIQEGSKITFANCRLHEMLGYKMGELIGVDHWIIYHPDYQDAVQERAKARLEGKPVPPKHQVKLMRKDGSYFDGEVNAKLLTMEGKQFIQVWVRDISEQIKAEQERRMLEDQLRQAQKMEAIGTLAGGIAHDFNNLLTAIQGSVSLMLMDLSPDHPFCQLLSTIEKQVKSGAKLTSQLLGYARKGKFEPIPIDINQLIKETAEAFGRTRKEITISYDLAKDLFLVEADHSQMQQILLNLFVNAAEAMPTGGNLTIRTRNVTHDDMSSRLYKPKPGPYVMIEVTDTGIGMDEKTMERIFEPFFTTKEMGRGTGLGLASVYGIIKSHNGYINVKSKPNHGTTFSIYLPSTKRSKQNKQDTSSKIIEGKGTIMIVDDEEIVLEVGAKMLERLGYSVIPVTSGKEAIELFQASPNAIDMVILDMVMPDMNGDKVFERLRSLNPNIKILLSSGYTSDGKASELLSRGCNGFIQKPFTIKELSEKTSKILQAPQQ